MPHGSNNAEVLSVLLILLVIVTVNNARNRHRLTKSALVHPKFSPWINLLRNADDGSFLTITGFSRFAFNELEKVLFDADGMHSVGSKRGRPELIDNRGKLGIYLLYVTSRMEVKMLCLIFGVPPTTCIGYINKMLQLVIKRLAKNDAAKIHFPKSDEEKSFICICIRSKVPPRGLPLTGLEFFVF